MLVRPRGLWPTPDHGKSLQEKSSSPASNGSAEAAAGTVAS
jgi:branched-chain amino acid transport system permease protein